MVKENVCEVVEAGIVIDIVIVLVFVEDEMKLICW